MAYSLQADIEKRIPAADVAALTDDTNGVTTDTAILTEAGVLADSVIDSNLRGKHTVPLTTVPPLIRELSVTLTIWNLYQRRINLAIPETLEAGFKDAKQTLKDIRDNKITIDDSGSHANEATYYKTNKTGDSRVFDQNDSESGTLDKYFSKHRMTPGGVH